MIVNSVKFHDLLLVKRWQNLNFHLEAMQNFCSPCQIPKVGWALRIETPNLRLNDLGKYTIIRTGFLTVVFFYWFTVFSFQDGITIFHPNFL